MPSDSESTTASTSKRKDTTALAQAMPLPELRIGVQPKITVTPPRRISYHSSIPTVTKRRLHELDAGKCLITSEKTPTASQQVVHIIARKTPESEVRSCVFIFTYVVN